VRKDKVVDHVVGTVQQATALPTIKEAMVSPAANG